MDPNQLNHAQSSQSTQKRKLKQDHADHDEDERDDTVELQPTPTATTQTKVLDGHPRPKKKAVMPKSMSSDGQSPTFDTTTMTSPLATNLTPVVANSTLPISEQSVNHSLPPTAPSGSLILFGNQPTDHVLTAILHKHSSNQLALLPPPSTLSFSNVQMRPPSSDTSPQAWRLFEHDQEKFFASEAFKSRPPPSNGHRERLSQGLSNVLQSPRPSSNNDPQWVKDILPNEPFVTNDHNSTH